MLNYLIVIVLSGTKHTNIKRLYVICKMRVELKRNNIVFMLFNYKVIMAMGDIAIKKQ